MSIVCDKFSMRYTCPSCTTCICYPVIACLPLLCPSKHFLLDTLMALDVYLSIKAYQMHKKIQKENGEVQQMSKNKLKRILQQLKSMITLFVTILGNTTLTVIASIIYVSASTVEGPSPIANTCHIVNFNLSVYPLVYGLYFTNIHQPLCRRLKHTLQSCKY